EALAHPLIVITVPAHDVAPPLMRDFMWGDIFPKVVRATARAEQLRSLGRIDERDIRHEHQSGPCLTKEAGRLLRHGDARVGQLAEISAVYARRVFRVRYCLVGHAGGGN